MKNTLENPSFLTKSPEENCTYNHFIEHAIKYAIDNSPEKQLRDPNLYNALVQEEFTKVFYKPTEDINGQIEKKRNIRFKFEKLDFDLKSYFSVRVPCTSNEGRLLLLKARLVCPTSKGPVYCEVYIPAAYTDRHNYKAMAQAIDEFRAQHKEEFTKIGVIEISGDSLINENPDKYLQKLQVLFEQAKQKEKIEREQRTKIENQKKPVKTIQLNVQQKEALSRSLPLVLTGEAGTGKSSTIEEILKKACLQAQMTSQKFTVIYFTMNQALCSKIRAAFDRLDKSDNFELRTFVIDSLLEAFDPESLKADRVGYHYFKDWFKKERSYLKYSDKQIEALYSELRLIAACVDESVYHHACGERNKNSDDIDKKIAQQLYQDYIKHLNESQPKRIDLFLQPFHFEFEEDLANSVQYILFDEAQNFPFPLLNALLRHPQRYNKSVIIVDPNQKICALEQKGDSISTVDMLKKNLTKLIEIFEGKQKLSICDLKQKFRNAQPIADLATYFLRFTYEMYGKESKAQAEPTARCLTGLEGNLEYFEDIASLRGIPNLVTIVPNEDAKKQLAPHLSGKTIVTVEEVQGLQFSKVALVGFFDKLSHWDIGAIEKTLTTFLKKGNHDLESFLQLLTEEGKRYHRSENKFNQTQEGVLYSRMLYVALSRAMEELKILGPQPLIFNSLPKGASKDLKNLADAPTLALSIKLICNYINTTLLNQSETIEVISELPETLASPKAKQKLPKEEIKEEEKINDYTKSTPSVVVTNKPEPIISQKDKENLLETIHTFLDSSLEIAHQHASNELHRGILEDSFSFNHFAVDYYLHNINRMLNELAPENPSLIKNKSIKTLSKEKALLLTKMPYFVNTIVALAEIANKKVTAFKQLVIFLNQLKTLERLQKSDPYIISFQALQDISINNETFFEYLRKLTKEAPTVSDQQNLSDCIKEHLNSKIQPNEVIDKRSPEKIKKLAVEEHKETLSISQPKMTYAQYISAPKPKNAFIDDLIDNEEWIAPKLFKYIYDNDLTAIKTTFAQIQAYNRLSDIFKLRAKNGSTVLDIANPKPDTLKFISEMLFHEDSKKFSALLDSRNEEGHSVLRSIITSESKSMLALLISYCTDVDYIKSLWEDLRTFNKTTFQGVDRPNLAKGLVLVGRVNAIEAIINLYRKNELNLEEVKELKELFKLAVKYSKYNVIETFLKYMSWPDQSIRMENIRKDWDELLVTILNNDSDTMRDILDRTNFDKHEMLFLTDLDGNTLLHRAVDKTFPSAELVCYLAMNYIGYEEKLLDCKNIDGKTVFDCVEENGNQEILTHTYSCMPSKIKDPLTLRHWIKNHAYANRINTQISAYDADSLLEVAHEKNFEHHSAWSYAYAFNNQAAITALKNAYKKFGIPAPSFDDLIKRSSYAPIKHQLEEIRDREEVKKYAATINIIIASLRTDNRSKTLSNLDKNPELLIRILVYTIFTDSKDFDEIIDMLVEKSQVQVVEINCDVLKKIILQYAKNHQIDAINKAFEFDDQANAMMQVNTKEIKETLLDICSLIVDKEIQVTKNKSLETEETFLLDNADRDRDCIQTHFITAIKRNDIPTAIQMMQRYTHNPLYLLNVKERGKTVLQLAIMHRNKKIFNHLFAFFEKAYVTCQALISNPLLNLEQQEKIQSYLNQYQDILSNMDSNNMSLVRTALLLDDSKLIGNLIKFGVIPEKHRQYAIDLDQKIISNDLSKEEKSFLQAFSLAEPEQYAKLMTVKNAQKNQDMSVNPNREYYVRLFEIVAKKTMLNDRKNPSFTASSLDLLKKLVDSSQEIDLDLNNLVITSNKKSKGQKKSAIEYMKGIDDQELQQKLTQLTLKGRQETPCSTLEAILNYDDVTHIPTLLSDANTKLEILMQKDKNGKTVLAHAVTQIKPKLIRALLHQYDAQDCLAILLQHDHDGGKNLLEIWQETKFKDPIEQGYVLEKLLKNLDSTHLEQLIFKAFLGQKNLLKEIIESNQEVIFDTLLTLCREKGILFNIIHSGPNTLMPWSSLLKNSKMLMVFLKAIKETNAVEAFLQQTDASGLSILHHALLNGNLGIFNILLKARAEYLYNDANPLKNIPQLKSLLQLALVQGTHECFYVIINQLNVEEIKMIGQTLIFELIEKNNEKDLASFCIKCNNLDIVPNFYCPEKGSAIFYAICLGDENIINALTTLGANIWTSEKKTKEELNCILNNYARKDMLEISKKRLEQWLCDNPPLQDNTWEIQLLELAKILGHDSITEQSQFSLEKRAYFKAILEKEQKEEIEKALLERPSHLYNLFIMAIKCKDETFIRSFLNACKSINCDVIASATSNEEEGVFVHPRNLIAQAIALHFYTPQLLDILLEIYKEEKTYILMKTVKLHDGNYHPLLITAIYLQDLKTVQLVLDASTDSKQLFADVISMCSKGENTLHTILKLAVENKITPQIAMMLKAVLDTCQRMDQFLLNSRTLAEPDCPMLFHALATKQLSIISMFIEAAMKENCYAKNSYEGHIGLLNKAIVIDNVSIVKVIMDAIKKTAKPAGLEKILSIPDAIFASSDVFDCFLKEGMNPNLNCHYPSKDLFALFKSKNSKKTSEFERLAPKDKMVISSVNTYDLALFAKKDRVGQLKDAQNVCLNRKK